MRKFTKDEQASLKHALKHLTVNRIADTDFPLRGWYYGNREVFVRRHRKAIALMESLLNNNNNNQ